MICIINIFNLLITNQLGFLAGQSISYAITECLDKAYDSKLSFINNFLISL